MDDREREGEKKRKWGHGEHGKQIVLTFRGDSKRTSVI